MKKKILPFLIIFGIIFLLFGITNFLPISDIDVFIYNHIKNFVELSNMDIFFTNSRRYVFLIFFALYIAGILFSKLIRRILVFGFLPIYFCISALMIYFNFFDFAIFKNIVFFLLGYLVILYYYYIRYEQLQKKEFNDSKLMSRVDGNGVFEDITVLFVDIQNYTGISEKFESPTLISKFLNYYILYIEGIIVKYDGILDKVMGDGIMLIFRGKDKEKRAVKCALEVLYKKDYFVESLKHMVIGNFQKGLIEKENIEKGAIYSVLKQFRFNFKVGIATGSVFMGNVGGKNINAMTVIGDTVNLANRLEAANKIYKTNLLTDEKTVSALGNEFLFRFVDKIRVRGKKEISNIYQPFKYKEVVEILSLNKESLILWNIFINHYFKKNYQEALTSIGNYIKSNPNDMLAMIYYNRINCMLKDETLLPPDWDGTREFDDCKL